MPCSKAEPDALLAAQNAALQDEVQHLRHLLEIVGVSPSQAPDQHSMSNRDAASKLPSSKRQSNSARPPADAAATDSGLFCLPYSISVQIHLQDQTCTNIMSHQCGSALTICCRKHTVCVLQSHATSLGQQSAHALCVVQQQMCTGQRTAAT